MRGVFEQIIAHPQGVDAASLREIQRYAKLFWVNNGPYNNLTARKFVLNLTPQALAAAVKAATAAGATFTTPPGESVDAMLTRLGPMFFDPNVDPIVTNKTPGPGRDILTASANNLYSGVSMADLKGFTEKYGLNSRLVKRDGRLVEEVYRIDGRYGAQIANVVKHLEAAIPFASAPMANALRALIQFYRTGEDADRAKYDIAWVQDKDSPVDTINGFIEVYMDPRGIKGSWESLVFYVNPEKTEPDPDARGKRPVVRGSDAVEPAVPQAERHRHHRQRHRRRRRDRRLRSGDAGRHQPAQRSAHPRAVRQQVDLAGERQRGVRQVDARHRCAASSRGRRTKPQRAEKFGTLGGELHHRPARSARPRVGTPEGGRDAARRRN